MAKSKNNVITRGLSGKIGEMLIFRQVGGRTVVSTVTEQQLSASDAQTKHRKRFQQAAIYAKGAAHDEQAGDLYAAAAKQRKISAFNVALADFLNGPDIELVDISKYTGAPGDEIRIIASDNFAVESVFVNITNIDGSLVEEGYAVKGLANSWVYVAQQTNENLEGDRILITAADLPGNVTEQEEVL
jgi:hypothetical protein